MVRLEIQYHNLQFQTYINLHSSMVRLEICYPIIYYVKCFLFTFQYGQIRNIVSQSSVSNLHKFTFQYGQIRNINSKIIQFFIVYIYIPVWLDQKYQFKKVFQMKGNLLHSSMVRLEIVSIRNLNKDFYRIYIPVWLDQKYTKTSQVLTPTTPFTFQYGQIRNLQKQG